MNVTKLILNALLAGFWAGIAALQVSGELTKATLFAAGAAAIRAIVGYVADLFGKPVPVDA